MKTIRMLIVLGLVGLVAGCSSGDSDGGGPSAEPNSAVIDVGAQVAGNLADLGIPADPDSLECDQELPPEVGASAACEFTTDGQPVKLVTKVESVDGDQVTLDVSTEALAVPKGNLEAQVHQRMLSAMGANLDSVECEGDLQAEAGASTGCTLAEGETTREVTATVTSVEGGLVVFDITD